jgi:hypothetical protein
MNPAAPKVWLALDHPSGLVIEDTSGALWRVPEMALFDGDRSTLQPIRRGGDPTFPGELFIDLVGVAEIAERAHVDAGTVHAWRSRHDDFPTPMATLKSGSVWPWAGIERWLRVRPPSGRPARIDAVAVRLPVSTSPVVTHLRADGVTTIFRLRDRFEPGSVKVEIDGRPIRVVEGVDGRRFSLPTPPSRGTYIKLEYRSVLSG